MIAHTEKTCRKRPGFCSIPAVGVVKYSRQERGVIMSVLKQLFLIFAVCLAGEGLSALLPFTFPAAVAAMVILLILLACRVVKPNQLQETGGFLLDNMAFFFVPVCVGVLEYWDVVVQNLWPILLISLLTTPVVFFVTGHVVQLTVRLMDRKETE